MNVVKKFLETIEGLILGVCQTWTIEGLFTSDGYPWVPGPAIGPELNPDRNWTDEQRRHTPNSAR